MPVVCVLYNNWHDIIQNIIMIFATLVTKNFYNNYNNIQIYNTPVPGQRSESEAWSQIFDLFILVCIKSVMIIIY